MVTPAQFLHQFTLLFVLICFASRNAATTTTNASISLTTEKPQNSSACIDAVVVHERLQTTSRGSTRDAKRTATPATQCPLECSELAVQPSDTLRRQIGYIIKTVESGRDSTALWQLNQLLFHTMDDERVTVMILDETLRLYPPDHETLVKIFHLVISSVNICPADIFVLLLDAQYSPKSSNLPRLQQVVESLTKNVLYSNATIPPPKPESAVKAIKRVFENIFKAVKPYDAEWIRLDKWLGRDFYESLKGLSPPNAYLAATEAIEAGMKGELLTANQWLYIQELYHSCTQDSTDELILNWEEDLLSLNGTCNGAFGRRYILNSQSRRILARKSRNDTDASIVISNYIQSISDRRFDYMDVKIRDDILLAHLIQVTFHAVQRNHFTCNQSSLSLELLSVLGRNRGVDLGKYQCLVEKTRNVIGSSYSRFHSFGKALGFIQSVLPATLETTGVNALLELSKQVLPQDVFHLGCYLYQNNMTEGSLWNLLPVKVQGQVRVVMSEQILKWVVRVGDDYFEIVPRSFELVKIAFFRDGGAAGDPKLWLFMPHVAGEHLEVGIYSLDREGLQKIYESYSYVRGHRLASFSATSTFRIFMLENMETFYLFKDDIPFCLHRDGYGLPLDLNLCIGDYDVGEPAEFYVCPDENDWGGVLEHLKSKYVG